MKIISCVNDNTTATRWSELIHKIMNEEQIFKLQINQLVKVKCNEGVDGWFIAKVKMINDWTKRVGVVDSNEQFKEYPYWRILSCL